VKRTWPLTVQKSAFDPKRAAQNQLAVLVPDAVHITDTHSGHNIMIDNAPVVIRAIRMVVDAVRAGQTSLKG
jgi:hypothetical protein